MQVHTILGVGDFNANTPLEKAGHMSDPVASPNDPVFIIHQNLFVNNRELEKFWLIPIMYHYRGT